MDLQTPTPEPTKKSRKIPLPELAPPNKTSPANQVCWYVGGLMVILGLTGFVFPTLMGFHLSTAHNLIHIVTGGLALGVGLVYPDYIVKKFAYGFGGFYLLLGLAGFVFGETVTVAQPATPPAEAATGTIAEESSFMWRLIPDQLELGLSDHVLHVVLGGIFIVAAYMTLRKVKKAAF